MTSIKPSTLKRFAFTFTLMGIASTVGCQSSQYPIASSTNPVNPQLLTPIVQPTQPTDSATTLPASPVAQGKQYAAQPTIGKVERLVNGDLMCYVTLIDENNVRHEDIGASFDLCANQNTYLNQKVQATYELVSVSDCQSAEPCGKTRQKWLITKMEILGNPSSDSQTLTNGKWTITMDNFNSWSGVNGTGNLGYRGCDSTGRCIQLIGGQMTCRDGVCTMGWRRGEYWYVVEQPMGNPDRAREPGTGTMLIVRRGTTIILRTTGFKAVFRDRSTPT